MIIEIKTIRQADAMRCPFCILVPDHYREDGSCKCNDPEYQKMMIREWGYRKRDFKRVGRLKQKVVRKEDENEM